jgi:hypothetical protein
VRRALFPCALALLGAAGVARADQAAAPALAAALRRAEETGALARVLGEHRFSLTRTLHTLEGKERGRTELDMVYRLSLADGVLTVAVDVRAPGAPSGVAIVYSVVAATGRLRGLESSFPGGQAVSARLEGDRLRVRESAPGAAPAEREEQVDPDALLPKVVGAFLLPMLHDQGLPERLPFRDLNPFGAVGGPATLRRAFATAREVVFCTDEGGALPATTLRVALDGPRAHQVVEFATVSESEKTPSGEDRVVHLARSVRR